MKDFIIALIGLLGVIGAAMIQSNVFTSKGKKIARSLFIVAIVIVAGATGYFIAKFNSTSEGDSGDTGNTEIVPPDGGDSDTTNLISGSCGESTSWQLDLDSGLLTISGSGEINDYPWSKLKNKIYTITIQNGVTAIGNNAFSGCELLTDVVIADSVKSIGNSAFSSCIHLENIQISSLSEISSIAPFAFYKCGSLQSFSIPDGVRKIESWTFFRCKSLTDIDIPDSVLIIDSFAFSGCTNLSYVSIPKKATVDRTSFEKSVTIISR